MRLLKPVRPAQKTERAATPGAVAFAVSAFLVAYALTGFPVATDYSKVLDSGIFPDVLYDRATAWEALWGDPHRSVSLILPEHGYPDAKGGLVARTPAALLLQMPLLLIPEGGLMWITTLLILTLLGMILWLTHRISGVDLRLIMWVAPLLMLSLPVVTTISYGSLGVMMALVLILIAWMFLDREWAGIPLGVAAATRLWPGLIIVGFWLSGRRRAAYQALAAFVVLQAAGLLLPGVTLSGSLSSVTHSGEAWLNHNMNASLALVLLPYGIPPVLAVAFAAAIGLLLAWRNKPNAIPVSLVAAILASPLSWPSYSLSALPIVAHWWRKFRLVSVAVLASPLVLWPLVPTRWRGHAVFVVLVLLLVFASRWGIASEPRQTVDETVPRASR